MTPIDGVPGIGPARRSVLADRGLRTAFDVLEADEREHEPWEQLHGIGREGWEGLVAWARAQRVDARAHADASERRATRRSAERGHREALEAMESALRAVSARRVAVVPRPDRDAIEEQFDAASSPAFLYEPDLLSRWGCLNVIAQGVACYNVGMWMAGVLWGIGAAIVTLVVIAVAMKITLAVLNAVRRSAFEHREKAARAEYQRLADDRAAHEARVDAMDDLRQARAFVASLRSAGVAGTDAVPVPSITFEDAPDVIERLNAHYLRALEASRAWQAASPR